MKYKYDSLLNCLKDCKHDNKCNLENNLVNFIEKQKSNAILLANREFSEIAHTIRHDLRNFVAAIEGYAYLLKDEFDANYLDRITKNTTNINGLIDRVLTLTDSGLKIESKESINLNDVVSKIKDKLDKSISITTTNLNSVFGDSTKISQIFTILLDNSIKHGKAKHLEINGLNIENYYKLQFINDGVLIPEKLIPNLFSKVHNLKSENGTGLMRAKKLSEAHGWMIQFNNEIKDKVCFEILIPDFSLLD